MDTLDSIKSLSRDTESEAVAAVDLSDGEEQESNQFYLSELYREKLLEIRRQGEMRAERFATLFRFYMVGFFTLFAALGLVGGRPMEEFVYQLVGIAALLIYTIGVYFLLHRSNRYYGNLKYLSSTFEIALLTFILGFLAWSTKNPTMIYSGAIPFIYFILIALASIRGDKSVIFYSMGLSLLLYGILSFVFLGDMQAILGKIAEYSNLIAPEFIAANPAKKFNFVSITPMGISLKLLYMLVTGGLLVYALVHSQRTSKRQSNLIFNTEKEAILKEKEKSDYLLLNILPESIAQELKEEGKTTPRQFNAISVLFTDFKGFTQIAEQLTPEELVHELDTAFRYFDEVIEKYNIEKIKTIGDAYMCAGGLPVSNRTHAISCVLAALAIQNYMNEEKVRKVREGKIYWEIRVGIHTGNVIAGVVGKKKFAYDIWGDTVNIASRMESSGFPGRVNISEETYEHVKDYFVCQYRGEIEAKNKGKVKMYFVHSIRPELSVNEKGVEPGPELKAIMSRLEIEDTARAS